MAVSVTGKVLLDTNVFIDYLRADLHPGWIFGGVSNSVRFLSAVVLMELRLSAPIRPGAKGQWIVYRLLFHRGGLSLRCRRCLTTPGDCSARFTAAAPGWPTG